MFSRIVVATVAALALSAPAFAADSQNLQVFRDVQKQILQYPHFTIFDSISASIDDGVLTLTGKVTMPYKRDDIAKRVGTVAGVKTVNDQIQVLPTSPFDDQLRVGIARAIYSNPDFRPYAAMANPPIHVIVDRGNVTLEGVVTSEIDRVKARVIANSFGSFSVTNNLKLDSEVAQALEQL